MTKLRTQLRSGAYADPVKKSELENAIAEQLAFHKRYGGKIFAVGRVSGKPESVKEDLIKNSKQLIIIGTIIIHLAWR